MLTATVCMHIKHVGFTLAWSGKKKQKSSVQSDLHLRFSWSTLSFLTEAMLFIIYCDLLVIFHFAKAISKLVTDRVEDEACACLPCTCTKGQYRSSVRCGMRSKYNQTQFISPYGSLLHNVTGSAWARHLTLPANWGWLS